MAERFARRGHTLHAVPEADEAPVSAVSENSSPNRHSQVSPKTPLSVSFAFMPPSFHGNFGYKAMKSVDEEEYIQEEDIVQDSRTSPKWNSPLSPSCYKTPASPPRDSNEVPPSQSGLGISMNEDTTKSRNLTGSIRRVPVASKSVSYSTEQCQKWFSNIPAHPSPASTIRSNWDRQPGESPSVSFAQSTSSFSVHSTPAAADMEDDQDEFDDEIFMQKFGQPPSTCRSSRDIYGGRRSWLSITILILSVYSTVMSAVWFLVAVIQPRWGHRISSDSGLQPSTATLLAALIAKTIELSFVTVFISCIGQILTRRAILRSTTGMTLAEMTMRNWVFQPGSLLTHFETLPYAGASVLGALCLTATMAAMFYTTASDAMVAPKLKYGNWEHKELRGYVRSSYANIYYFGATCPALLSETQDSKGSQTCMNIEFSGESYRNLQAYMSIWETMQGNQTSVSTDLKHRPSGTMLLYENTTLTSSWIETQHSNVTAKYEAFGRIINNVTMAMPHPGVYEAAISPLNDILQPSDLAGVGEYAIKAGAVSPSVSVMCVNMDEDELKPLIYTAWPNAKTTQTVIPGQRTGYPDWADSVPKPLDENKNPNYLNATVVDDIFRWGKQYKRYPPVFGMYLAAYNMLVNETVDNSDSIYILSLSPGESSNYTLCEMRSWLSPVCSSQLSVSGGNGASMTAHCEDPEDKNSYMRSYPDNQKWPLPSTDWKWFAQQWELSMAVSGGETNANASNNRLLSQLALTTPELPPHLPSMAEALAVYAGSTAVTGAIDSPYVHYFEYNAYHNILPAPGQVGKFNASIITQQYTSGHTSRWQNIFYIILALVLVINVFCAAYFLRFQGLVTDFTEPQNLFALAVNSPPSAQLVGSCGGGPRQRDLVVPWRVAYAPSSNHYFFQEASERPWRGRYKDQEAGSKENLEDLGLLKEGSSYKRLSRSKNWLL